MSNFIYTPYFYIIQHISSGKYYAGSRTAENCHPNELLKKDGYPTSSNIIKQILEEEGLESFIIRRIKTFSTSDEAFDYETKFLNKVNASVNENFYNGHNNLISPFQSKEFCEMMIKLYGVENYSKHPDFKEKREKTCLEKFGEINNSKTKEWQEKVKFTSKIKYGSEWYSQTDERNERIKSTSIEKYGVPHFTQNEEVKQNYKNRMMEKYGVDNSFKSEEIKEKIKVRNRENFGVDYPMQSDIVKQKALKTRKKLSERDEVMLIRKYNKKFKLTLGPGWYQRSTEVLKEILEEYYQKYGKI